MTLSQCPQQHARLRRRCVLLRGVAEIAESYAKTAQTETRSRITYVHTTRKYARFARIRAYSSSVNDALVAPSQVGLRSFSGEEWEWKRS